MNALNDVHNQFKELNESLKELQVRDPSLIPDNMAVQDVTETDDKSDYQCSISYPSVNSKRSISYGQKR